MCLCGVQIPTGVSADSIKGLFLPYGNIEEMNVMAPKKEGSMGECHSKVGFVLSI